MTNKQVQRFKISVADNGYYQVSIPNYEGGKVVPAEAYDEMKRAATWAVDILTTFQEDEYIVGRETGIDALRKALGKETS